jgi:hypothetical protein
LVRQLQRFAGLAEGEANVFRSITAAMVVLFSTAALGGARNLDQSQAPSPAKPQTPAPTTSSQQSVTTGVTTTLVGCLYREDQVPGRKPNIAERAGILEDYILADAKVKNEQGKSGASDVAGTSGSVPASGSLYKVEKIPDDRLKTLVGKRVEVTGRIDPQHAQRPGPGSATGAPTPDLGPSPDKINLPEFEASSIREVSGQCPAAPAPGR